MREIGLTALLALPAVLVAFFVGRILGAAVTDRSRLADGPKAALTLAFGVLLAVLCLVVVRTTLLPPVL